MCNCTFSILTRTYVKCSSSKIIDLDLGNTTVVQRQNGSVHGPELIRAVDHHTVFLILFVVPNQNTLGKFLGTQSNTLALLLGQVMASLEHPQALLVIVPRHPDRFGSVAELAEKAGFNVARRSLQQDPAHAQVYLGDTMGELMMLYGAGDMAFVGGSLIERGGHNPLEPAAWGIPVLSGPHVFNFETVYERLRAGEGVVMVQSGDELGQAVVRLMATREERQALGERALAVVNKNRGALDRVVEGIVERL